MSQAERTFQVILSTTFTGTVVVAGVTLIGMGVILNDVDAS